jgi:hypothetical protein
MPRLRLGTWVSAKPCIVFASDSLHQATDVHAFLRLAGPTTLFAEQVLRLLTEERRAIHRERANEPRSPIS